VNAMASQHYRKLGLGMAVMAVVLRSIDRGIVLVHACHTVCIVAVVLIGSLRRSLIAVYHKHQKEQYFLCSNSR
jgi:hypothetical protein